MRAAKNDKVTKELSTRQKNRNKSIRLIVVSGILSLIVFIALLVVQSNILDMEEKIPVYVVKTEIKEGTKITSSNVSDYFTVTDRVVNTLPKNYIKKGDTSKLIDKFVEKDYAENEVVTSNALSDRASILDGMKKPVEVTFSSSAVNVVGGILREGDTVNIYRIKDGVATELLGKGYIYKAFEGTTEVATDDKESVTTMFSIVIEEEITTFFFENSAGTLKLTKVLYDTN